MNRTLAAFALAFVTFAPTPSARAGGWRWVSPDPQPSPIGRLNAVWGSGPNDVYVAGDGGILLRSADRGASWQRLESGTARNLTGIWGSGPNDVYVVGAGGTILHSIDRGAHWLAESASVTDDLNGIWGSGADDVYIVGDEPVILHKIGRGGAWQFALPSEDSGRFVSIWGSSPENVYAAGGAGDPFTGGSTLLYRSTDRGRTWKPIDTQRMQYLMGAWGSGGDVLFAAAAWIGFNGGILHVADGKVSMIPGPGGSLLGIWGASGVVLADGEGGMILRSPDRGVTWAVEKPTSGWLRAIWGSGPSDIYAVGDDATILHSIDAGKSWTAVGPHMTHAGQFFSVWGSGPNDVYALGKGRLLRTTDHGAHWTEHEVDASAITGLGASDLFLVHDSEILHSTDHGATFHALEPGGSTASAGLVAAWHMGADLWVADGDDAIRRSRDRGATWQTVVEQREPEGEPAADDLFWGNDQEGYFVAHLDGDGSMGANRFYLSIDRATGGHWETEEVFGEEIYRYSTRAEASRRFAYPGIPEESSSICDGAWSAGKRMYVVGPGGALVRSQDGGATWTYTSIAPGDRGTCAITGTDAAGLDLYAVGDRGTILLSTDGGSTWHAEDSGTTANLVNVWASGPSDVYVAGDDAILHRE